MCRSEVIIGRRGWACDPSCTCGIVNCDPLWSIILELSSIPLCSALCPHYPGDHFCHSINFKFSPFTFTILCMRLRVLLYHYLLQTSFEVIVFHEKHLGALGLKNSRQFPLFQGVGSSEMHLNLNGTQSSCGLFSFNKWRIVGIVWGRKLKTTLCYIRGRETRLQCN